MGANREWLRRGMDQSEAYRRKTELLAAKSGVARQTISAILNGKGEGAERATLARLADALDIPMPGEGVRPFVVPVDPVGKVRAAIGLLSEAARDLDSQLKAAASAERKARLAAMKQQASHQPASGRPAKKRRHG